MKDSVLLRRILTITTVGVIMTMLLTVGAYTLLSRTVFTEIRENELTPKANALGVLVREYLQEGTGADTIRTLLKPQEGSNTLLGAYALVLDADNGVLFSTGDISNEYHRLMEGDFLSILGGRTLTTPRTLRLVHSGAVVVGTPVYGDTGEIIAAVILIVPMLEASASITSMYSALLLAMAVVLPVVGLFTYLLADRISRPLRQMNKVALEMAGGTFTARADVTQGGELGELARSLNFLARELSGTISDLTLERNRLRDVIDGLEEGLAAVDATGRVTHVNTALARMFAGSRVLTDGSAGSEQLGLIPFPEVWEDFSAVLAGKGPAVRKLQSENTILLAHITPLTGEGGRIAGAVCMLSDITQAELLETTRREYVANVSHELRTPLTALRGLVEPMRDGLVKTEADRQRYYDIILRETMRLSRLIDDLMELSRLQSGTLSMECENTDMSLILGDLQEKYQAIAEDNDIEFSLSFDPETVPPVWTNADRAEEVLVILLDNAIKYTPAGGHVTLGAAVRPDRLDLSVADTGIGISEADIPHIFERFYKVDKAHHSKGSGLGLSIAHEMLEKMHSELTVESKEGEGSVFRFSLPRTRR